MKKKEQRYAILENKYVIKKIERENNSIKIRRIKRNNIREERLEYKILDVYDKEDEKNSQY